jgi:hypothetical protein
MAMAKTTGGRKISRKQTTLIWIVAVTAVVITLLYFERADVLYVLSTVGVTVLLVMVARADLSGAKKNPGPAAPDWSATKGV